MTRLSEHVSRTSFSAHQHSPALALYSADEGFDPIDRNLRRVSLQAPGLGAKRIDPPREASTSPLRVGPIASRRSTPQERGSASERRAWSVCRLFRVVLVIHSLMSMVHVPCDASAPMPVVRRWRRAESPTTATARDGAGLDAERI
jgi:hypothetical protein